MKKFYLFLSLAMVAGGVSARQISEQEARALAASKISLEDNAVMRVISRDSTMPTSSSSSSSAPVYMFNSPKGGFAIISGDDRMPNMVLAYSETGSLDPDNCSPAMRA